MFPSFLSNFLFSFTRFSYLVVVVVRLGALPFFLPFFFNSELDDFVLSDIAESSKEESESLIF